MIQLFTIRIDYFCKKNAKHAYRTRENELLSTQTAILLCSKFFHRKIAREIYAPPHLETGNELRRTLSGISRRWFGTYNCVRLDTRFSIHHGKFVFRNIPKMYIQNYKRILGALEIHHQQQCDLKNPQLEYL